MPIKFLTDAKKDKKSIESSISRFGHGPEHNFEHYLNLHEHGATTYFASFGKNKGFLVLKNPKNEFITVDRILSPPKEQLSLFEEFLDTIFTKEKALRAIVETPHEFRLALMKKLKTKYHFPKIRYYLDWPVFDLKLFDPGLKGGKWKKIRNLMHRLTKNHKVKVVDSNTLDKRELIGLVDRWIRSRFVRDTVEKERYVNLINNNFKCADYARSIVVDGKVATISAGWKIPNSKNVYSAIGILDYSAEELGEYAYWDELSYLKSKGFEKADFGGSDDAMLRFKKKFKPESIYRTDIFAITKKK